MRLYLVLAAGDTDVLEPALRGGVDVVQLRDKTLGDRELIRAARAFRRGDRLRDPIVGSLPVPPHHRSARRRSGHPPAVNLTGKH